MRLHDSSEGNHGWTFRKSISLATVTIEPSKRASERPLGCVALESVLTPLAEPYVSADDLVSAIGKPSGSSQPNPYQAHRTVSRPRFGFGVLFVVIALLVLFA